jgi:hypothetical protein
MLVPGDEFISDGVIGYVIWRLQLWLEGSLAAFLQ